MDNSETRFGNICWYKMDEIGFKAINDGFMIENFIYYLLKKHFSHLECYPKLMETFHDITLITTIGTSLDMDSDLMNVTDFTMKQFKSVAAQKTTHIASNLPMSLAMHLAGYKDPEVFSQMKAILIEMGYFHQIRNDYHDCFGDPKETRKIGNDIESNKCTWLAALCMERATPEQKQIMKECYGSNGKYEF